MSTVIEILNPSLEKVAEVKNPYPLDQRGMILRYSKELSDYGSCKFRISTKDPLLEEFGDIVSPHAYHVRVKRDGTTAWQGVIVDNIERNKNYIEVVAVQYLYYLDRILIRRDKDKPDTDEDESNFRVFKTGTMSSAVTTLVTQAAADFGASHLMADMSTGTIENPDYPDNFLNATENKLTGPWVFSDFVTLIYDYHSALYVLKAFGMYSGADFELDDSLVFNFKKQLGERISGVSFNYAQIGSNIVDYNVPRLGQRMANEIIGIAADDEGRILHATQRNVESVQRYGLLQTPEAYSDVKNKNMLNSRLKESLRLVSEPEDSPLNLVLDEKAYPLQYGVGDIVWVRIKDNIIDFNKERRVVGYTVVVHNTGRELITVQTNVPDPKLLGAS